MVHARRLLATSSSSQSRGALAGGFTKQNLEEWANRTWGNPKKNEDDKGHYVDLASHKLSPLCAAMLETHSHPSSAVSRAFFRCTAFAPERILVTTLGLASENSKELPLVFRRGDTYLLWTAMDVTPHELILGWEMGSSASGCTMLAVDPRTRKVYFGSGIKKTNFQQGFLFRRVLTPFHVFYSNLLLKSMVEELEKEAKNTSETQS